MNDLTWYCGNQILLAYHNILDVKLLLSACAKFLISHMKLGCGYDNVFFSEKSTPSKRHFFMKDVLYEVRCLKSNEDMISSFDFI